MTTINKQTQIGANTSMGKFLGLSQPMAISGIFAQVGYFEVTLTCCGKSIDDKITVAKTKYAELLCQDSENYYFGYAQ